MHVERIFPDVFLLLRCMHHFSGDQNFALRYVLSRAEGEEESETIFSLLKFIFRPWFTETTQSRGCGGAGSLS